MADNRLLLNDARRNPSFPNNHSASYRKDRKSTKLRWTDMQIRELLIFLPLHF